MTYPRDLIGYGSTPPHPKWPGKARIAVNFVLNYEEGSEYSIPDGDGFSETSLSERASEVPPGTRDLSAESVYEYGSRVGFWRVMRLFAERKLPLTVFACGLALERNPEAARAIAAAVRARIPAVWSWKRVDFCTTATPTTTNCRTGSGWATARTSSFRITLILTTESFSIRRVIQAARISLTISRTRSTCSIVRARPSRG